MLRLKAERRSLAKVSGASAAKSPDMNAKAAWDNTTETSFSSAARTDSHPHPPVHFPVRTSNAAAWALFTLVVGTFLIVACVLLTLGAPS